MGEGKSLLSTSLQNKSVVESIIDRIVSAIIEGELGPGDRLPTEMELCRDLGVGRNSVREAIKKLEAYGVVYIKRAEGTFVSETYNRRMLDPMLYGMILQKDSWQDLIELRRVLDIGTLDVVISHQVTEEQLDTLKACVEQMERAMDVEKPSVTAIMEADSEFHMAIARFTGNEQLVNITDYITRITIPSRRKTIKRVLEEGGTEHFIDLHRQLIQVIEHQKYEQISKAVMDHYVYWKEEEQEM